jgi:dipeptidyl aminopeptidase/acylaminoacyl peptidase
MPKLPITHDDLARIKYTGDPQMSPDGTQVMYTIRYADVARNRYFTHLWLHPLNEREARQLTVGEVSDGSARWSPDGKSIAFIRAAQVWMLPVAGGEARTLTSLPQGRIGELRWSPDGKRLAFAFCPIHADWSREAEQKREASGASKPPRVITHTRYKLDAEGFHDERQHIWLCDVATGKTTQITGGDYDDSAFPWWPGGQAVAWSPDSRTIAFTSNRIKDPDRHYFRNDVWLMPARGGKPKRLPTPVGLKANLSWSPDGKQIAYIAADSGENLWLPRNNYLWLVPVDGRSMARCLNGALDRNVGDTTIDDCRDGASGMPVWAADSSTLYVTVSDSGNAHLYAVDTASGEWTRLTEGATDSVGITADRAAHRFAVLMADPTHPPEVYTGQISNGILALHAISDVNGAWLQTVRVSPLKEFWLTQPAGTRVQGWVMRPPAFSAKRKYPCLLYVHGGPHMQYGNVFFHEMQWHAARGYIVVYGNPRGSNGRDTNFGACIHNDLGNLDYQDVMALADHAAALPYVDSNRMAIAGGSYGGFMTNWVVGHTNRFKAGVSDRSICNWISMDGTTDDPPPPDAYWPGTPWNADLQRRWDMSPLKFADRVRTPLLIIQSEGDLRCPISQAEEWFTALKWHKQEAVFVRYPSETAHALSRSGPIDLRLDRLKRIGDWLDSHLNVTGIAQRTKPSTAKTRRYKGRPRY